MGTQLPVPKKGALGTEVELGPGHIALDGDPATRPQKGGTAPLISGPCLLRPNGWMDQDATRYGVGLDRGHIVLDGDPPAKKGHNPPIFGTYLLWPNGWMDQDAT